MRVAVCISALPNTDTWLVEDCLSAQTYNNYETRILESNRPLSAVRNSLAEDTDADILAFLDADTCPTRRWLEELVEGFEDGHIAVGGPAYPYYTEGTFRLPREWEWLIGCGPYHETTQMVRNTYGCNFAIKRDVFMELGGFDEDYGKGARIPQGEEAELAQRMHREYGERMQYRPKAIVSHHISPEQLTIPSLLHRAYEQGYTKAHMDVEDEEHEMIHTALKSMSPLQYGLLAAGGIGYLRGILS